GQESLGVDLLPVSVAVEVAPETVAGPSPITVSAEGVELAGPGLVERHPEVGERHHVLFQAIAPVIVGLGEGIPLLDDLPVLGVDQVGDAILIYQKRIRPSPVGGIPVLIFTE